MTAGQTMLDRWREMAKRENIACGLSPNPRERHENMNRNSLVTPFEGSVNHSIGQYLREQFVPKTVAEIAEEMGGDKQRISNACTWWKRRRMAVNLRPGGSVALWVWTGER